MTAKIKWAWGDDDWKAAVRVYARAGRGKELESDDFRLISSYLWQDTATYKRLEDTLEGRFWREVDNPCPDYGLRGMYREKLLDIIK